MKKTSILLLLAAATVLVSCKKDNLGASAINENGGSTVSAVIDDDNSKTTLDGAKVLWTSGDVIAINKKQYLATPDATDARKATFKLGYMASAPKDAPFCAYYPFVANRTTSKGQFILPSTQNYGIDDKISNVSPMYAVVNDLSETFHFKNVCGLLTIDLKGEGTVSDITISANEYLAGILTNVAISDKGELTYDAIKYDEEYASKSVSLGCGEAATLSKETARRFYIALPEGDFTGVTLSVTTEKGTMAIPATKTVSIKKNNIYHLPEMTFAASPITFEFTQSNLTHNSVTYEVTPSLNTVNYYTEVLSKEKIESIGDVETYAAALLSYLLQDYTPEEIIEGIMDQGVSAYSYKLEPETDYRVIAFAVDSKCNIISDVATEAFTSLELPYAKADYEDYLGKWTIDKKAITFAEKVNGESYTMTGPWTCDSGNKIEAVYNKTLGCLELYEQELGGKYTDASGNTCQDFLSGAFYDGEGYYYGYPFNGDKEKILSLFKDNSGNFVFEGGSKLGSYSIEYIDLIKAIYKGGDVDDVEEYFDYPMFSSIEPSKEASAEYKAWLGNWTVNDAKGNVIPISINEAVADEEFSVSGLGMDFPLYYDKNNDKANFIFEIIDGNSSYLFCTGGVTNDNYVANYEGTLVEFVKDGNNMNINPIHYKLSEDRPDIYAARFGILGYKLATGGWVLFNDLLYIYTPASAKRQAVTSVAPSVLPNGLSVKDILRSDRNFSFNRQLKSTERINTAKQSTITKVKAYDIVR